MREYTWCRECERAARAVTLDPKARLTCPYCGSSDVIAWEVVRAINGRLPHQPRAGQTYPSAMPHVVGSSRAS